MNISNILNKMLLIVTILTCKSVNGFCSSSVLPISQAETPAFSSTSIQKLPIQNQSNLLTASIEVLSNQKFLNDYLEHIGPNDRVAFLTKAFQACMNIQNGIQKYGLCTLEQTLTQTSLQEDSKGKQQDESAQNTLNQKAPPLNYTEFNKNLALLSVRIDGLQDSYSVNELEPINEVLKQFVQLHSEDNDYGNLYFLIGLLKMLHCFPDKLPSTVIDKIPDILKSIDCTETTEIQVAKEAIYNYIVSVSEESLGEFHI